jgi:hypothetical protein
VPDLFRSIDQVSAIEGSPVTLVSKSTAFFTRAARYAWKEYNPGNYHLNAVCPFAPFSLGRFTIDVPPTVTFPGVHLFGAALSRYCEALPPLQFGTHSEADVRLLTAHTLAFSASIALHAVFIANHPPSLETCRKAVARIVSQARDMLLFRQATLCYSIRVSPCLCYLFPLGLADVTLQPGWEVALGYLRGLKNTPALDPQSSEVDIDEGINVLLRALVRLGELYPSCISSENAFGMR